MSLLHGKKDLRVWRNPHIVRRESPIKPQPAFLSDDLPRAVQHALIWQAPVRRPRLLLQPRLDKVERQTEERSEEPCYGASRQRLRLRRPRRVGFELRLGLGEERQLPEVQRHCARDGRYTARPQRSYAFCF